MKKLLFLITLSFMGYNFNSSATPEKNLNAFAQASQDPTIYYFIRHAEKDSSKPLNKDPKLAEEGVKRAEKWAEVFKDFTFDFIYSSNYNLTISTAQRVADSQYMDVKIYDARK